MSGAGAGWTELLAAAASIRAAAAGRTPEVAGTTIVAIGWATVEADRACRELDELLGPAAWLTRDRDPLLGARAWRREPRPVPGEGIDLLVLEPDTEGRIAAFLARFGEGVAMVRVRATGAAGVGAAAPGGRASVGRLVAGTPAWGPHVVVQGDR